MRDGTSFEDYLSLRKEASRYTMRNGILCRMKMKDKTMLQLPVIPPKLRNDIMKAVHDNKRAGHFAYRRTFARLRYRYFWNTMCRDVKEYTDGCETCARANVCRLAPAGLLVPLKPTIRPFSRVGYDKMGPIHKSAAGNEVIFTITDYCTKTVLGRATATGRAVDAVNFLLDQVINTFGAPNEIITDNGREFCNSYFKELIVAYDINHVTTTAYHPQSNGQTERLERHPVVGTEKIH